MFITASWQAELNLLKTCTFGCWATQLEILKGVTMNNNFLNAPIARKVICFKCLRSLYGKQCEPDQTAPIGAVCSGSSLFASTLNSSVMLGNYLQQTTSADDIFRCIFFLAL